MIYSYHTISSECEIIFSEKSSRFIAIACPIGNKAEALSILKKIKSNHPKARHWCYAYKIGINPITSHSEDDGEPSGTAGKPILNQIESFKLTNVLVVVVRYFGGILLGRSGLTKAYKESARICLNSAVKIEIDIKNQYEIRCSADLMYKILKTIKFLNLEYQNLEIQNDSVIQIEIPLHSEEKVWKEIKKQLDLDQLEEIMNSTTIQVLKLNSSL